jgi:hypothetical protein
MWSDGVYLGVKATTGEIILGTSEGIWQTRTVQKKPLGQRWHKKNFNMIGGVPWKRNANDDKANAEDMKGDVIRAEEPLEKPKSEMKDLDKAKMAKKRREDVVEKVTEMEDVNKEIEKRKRADEMKMDEEPDEKKSREEQASGSAAMGLGTWLAAKRSLLDGSRDRGSMK